MTTVFHGPIDLLRQRRVELGLPADPPRIQPAWRLILVGSLIGVAMVVPALGLQLVLDVWYGQVHRDLLKVIAIPPFVKQLDGKLQNALVGAKKLEASNQGLAKGLVTVSSGSALLTNLFQLAPSGLELKDATVSGTTLSLKGGVEDPGALRRINALQLQLAYSPMFQPGSIKVIKISRDGAAGATSGNLGFDLSAAFQALDSNAQLQQLQRLGSTGMARRLQILRASEVLK